MLTTNLQQLREDADGVVAAAQTEDVHVIDGGKVVAVVTKPPLASVGEHAVGAKSATTRSSADFEKYWQERERLLADVVASPGWDSTEAVSEDRDRA